MPLEKYSVYNVKQIASKKWFGFSSRDKVLKILQDNPDLFGTKDNNRGTVWTILGRDIIKWQKQNATSSDK